MMKIFLLKLGFFLSGLIWGVYALAAQPLQNKHLSGGLVHSLYIDSTGNVWVWGGSSLDGVSNELIPSIAMKEGRSAHSNFDSNTTFVIKQDGSLWGWGNTIAGQLRLFPKDDRMNSAFIDIPREILSHAIAVNGDGSIFAIKPDHSLWVWGHWGAQRGDAGRKDTLIPRIVMNDVVQVSSTNYHTLALQKDGTLWAWGDNQCGALGIGNRTKHVNPVKVKLQPLGQRKVTKIAVRWGESYIVADDGTVW